MGEDTVDIDNGIQSMIHAASLLRSVYRNDGTFGIFVVDTVPICLTCERPWLNNQTGVSCIPTGVYVCKRVNSPKFGDTFEVTNVKGRSEILLHRGNIDDDSHGCIILGESFNIWTTGQVSIASSKEAFAEFLQRAVGSDSFQLDVRELV